MGDEDRDGVWGNIRTVLSGEEDVGTWVDEASTMSKENITDYVHNPGDLVDDAETLSEKHHDKIMWAGISTAAISYVVGGGIEDTAKAVELL